MAAFSPQDELFDLLGSLCNCSIAAEEQDRLGKWLLEDIEARRLYVKYLDLQLALTDLDICDQNDIDSCELLPNLLTARDLVNNDDLAITPQDRPSPLLSTAYHGSVNFFSQEIPFACLMSTIIVGFALALVSLITKEHYTQMPGRSVASAKRSYTAPESERADKTRAVAKEQKEEVFHFVGRITGMVDCKWADPGRTFSSITDYSVALHDKYSLTSGLMEITYDTGAKVLLQGPVTYEVESTNGGYMSLGKLTGKVEVEKAKGFFVRTPTAIVTDLGTEFGVEVGEKGQTLSRVFRGKVAFVALSSNGEKQGDVAVLSANQSARAETKESGVRVIVVHDGDVKPDGFVRGEQLAAKIKEIRELPLQSFRRWQAFSEELRRDPSLVAYYDFQMLAHNLLRLENVAANGGGALNGIIEHAAWTNGRMAGKYAVRFNGHDHIETNFPDPFDDLTLAAWVCLERLPDPIAANLDFSGLLMSDGWNSLGQLHWQIGPDGRMCLDVSEGCSVRQAEPSFTQERLGRWTHLAVVYDHVAAKAAIYVDGQMTDEVDTQKHCPIHIGSSCIGRSKYLGTERGFHGRIDEMVIFNRPLAAKEIQSMVDAGKPETNNRPVAK